MSHAALLYGERAGLENPPPGIRGPCVLDASRARPAGRARSGPARAGGAVPAAGLALRARAALRRDRAHRGRAPRARAPGRRGLRGSAGRRQLAARDGRARPRLRRGRRSRPRPPAVRPAAPYAGRVVVVAQAHACLGAVAYYLGLLAALDERWDEAAARMSDDALHAPARPSVAHCWWHTRSARWRRCCGWAVPPAHRGRRPCTPRPTAQPSASARRVYAGAGAGPRLPGTRCGNAGTEPRRCGDAGRVPQGRPVLDGGVGWGGVAHEAQPRAGVCRKTPAPTRPRADHPRPRNPPPW